MKTMLLIVPALCAASVVLGAGDHLVALSPAPGAQGQDAAFAVASIKRNMSGLPYSPLADSPDGVVFINERLRDVILFAYDLSDFQLAGAPAWVSRGSR